MKHNRPHHRTSQNRRTTTAAGALAGLLLAVIAAASLLAGCIDPVSLLGDIEEIVEEADSDGLAPPPAPTDLVAEATGPTTVDLTWTDNSDDELSFQLQRRVAGTEDWGDAAAAIGSDVSTYSDSGLTPETDYEYRLRARNGAGDSDWSEIVNATTEALPTYTVTYHGNGHDSGTVPVDENEYVEGSTLTVSGSGDMAKTGETFVGWNTFDDGSGTQYQPSDPLVIQTSDVDLHAQWSASVYQLTVLSDAEGAIAAPAVSPVAVAHGADTTITATPNVGFGVDEWIVVGGNATIADPSAASTTVTLTAGDATIRATYVDTQAPSPPSTPDLASEDDSGSSHLDNITNQTSSLTFAGTAEPLATVELFSSYDGSLGTVPTDGTGAWTMDCSLSSQAGPHDVWATATDADGNTSAESDALAVVIDTVPPAPSTLTASHSDTFNEITVEWANSSGAEENRLWWSPGDGDPNVILGISEESFTATSLIDGVGYEFYLAAIDVAGNEAGPDTIQAIAPDEGMKRWDFDNGDWNDSTTPAVGSDGTVYVGSRDGDLYALNPDDGTVLWTFAADGVIEGAPVVSETGVIYVTSTSGYVYAVNPETHAYNWRFDAGTSVEHGVAMDSFGDLWLGAGSAVYKLNDISGGVLWSDTVSGSIATTPVIGKDGLIWVGVNEGSSVAIHALNPGGDGWIKPISTITEICTDFAVDDQGNLYVGTREGLLSLSTGSPPSVRWVFEPHSTVSQVYSTPVIGTDGTVFVGARTDYMYALDPSDGSINWSHNMHYNADAGPVVGANGYVYVMGNDGGVYAFNATTGAVMWSKSWGIVGAQERVSSILLGNGTLLVPDTGSYGTGVAALWTRSGGPAASPWPMYGYDLANSSRAPQ